MSPVCPLHCISPCVPGVFICSSSIQYSGIFTTRCSSQDNFSLKTPEKSLEDLNNFPSV